MSESKMGSVAESGQNAISVLLQPPIVRTGMLPHTSAPSSATHKPPTAKDIPPVTTTNIDYVNATAFEPYLAQVGALWDPFRRAEPERATGSVSRKEQGQLKDDDFAEMLERGQRREQISRKNLKSTLTPNKSPVTSRRASGGLSRRKLEVTSLSTIPPVYFDQNFQLENPRTFDLVSERSEVVCKPGTPSTAGGPYEFMNGSAHRPRKALATNAILQEKLSWYIDTVEVHLIPFISTASDSFFTTLESLRELQSEAAECVKRTKSLRGDLGSLNRKLALGGLKVIEIKRRRDNLHTLRDATEQLSSILQGVTQCEGLIDQGEFVLALDRLDLVDRLISGTLPLDGSNNLSWLNTFMPLSLIDLRELKASDALKEEIQQLRFRIGQGFEVRFLDTLLVDLRQHIKIVTPQDTLERWGSTFQRGRGDSQRPSSELPAYMKESAQVRQNLKACLLGLHRSRYTQQATVAFRHGIIKEMKALIRQHLPCSTDNDNESQASVSTRTGDRTTLQLDKSAILARNLRALDPGAAEDLYISVYSNVGEALRRLSIQVKVLLDVTSGTASPPLTSPSHMHSLNLSTLSNTGEFLSSGKSLILSSQMQEELTQALDMSSLLGQAVDVAQAQITKVLKVRSEQTVRLPLARFLRYFHLNRLFADECESVSGRSGATLKGVVSNQISEFIPLLGDLAKQQLASTMDADKWEAKDFGPEEGVILGRLLQGMTLDHQNWMKTSVVWEKLEEESSKPIDLSRDGDGATKNKVRNATIDEQSYILVESAIAALRGIDRFANLVVTIPGMTTEASNVLLDFLRLFNSRSCQLILGAGARHSAGLKNINSKHLALASQALSFFIALMPYLREFVRRHAINSPSLTEFDRVKRLYQDHQFIIHDKLIDIMSLRTIGHVSAMKKIDWDADTRETSPYMQTLTEETSKLHKVLSKNLPESTVASIVGPVIRSYKEQWGKAFDEAVVKTVQGKARLLRDVVLFGTQLNKIDGASEIGSHITEIVNEKQIDGLEMPADEQKTTVSPVPDKDKDTETSKS
ncbi:Vps54-like protein-domain-containing protein [Amylocarpus encephaloides]|uniref:Vps54-like protein-domain-containing protein n=1 Tax=Amylocarpus encephaloides TaxID=45428 RepID=A0A9P7Y6M7_9HELO|nr:Vps54-like protein-domain-containing protein [Amylocarpus encephaloides]